MREQWRISIWLAGCQYRLLLSGPFITYSLDSVHTITYMYIWTYKIHFVHTIILNGRQRDMRGSIVRLPVHPSRCLLGNGIFGAL